LDTANGQIGEKQLEWLDKDLQGATQTHKVVVMHYPPYVGSIGSLFQLSSEEEAIYFKDLMYKRNVAAVFAGHYHGYIDTVIGRTRYVVTGGANTILDPGNGSHYIKVNVTPSALTLSHKPI
jgi:3',5'-cyclic AMP phosphodiesterase CpdA